ncbi:N-terminal domain of NEFA-interacting nuclear protein NIP30-domain-containing protein, partial [Amylocystis lapponica]
VGSRFVTQDDVDTAKARRDEQWKAAYARLGQEPPPPPAEDAFDGRSLAEHADVGSETYALQAAKQEEWEERNKLGNQFRALEEDEVLFLDSVLEKQREEERLRKEMDGEEVKNFRQAVAARETEANKPPAVSSTTPSSVPVAPNKNKATAPAVKKDMKKALKGVLVKKRPKPVTSPPAAAIKEKTSPDEAKGKEGAKSQADDDREPQVKRRKSHRLHSRLPVTVAHNLCFAYKVLHYCSIMSAL